MKKKYLAMMLACVLGTSMFVSGCGDSSDAQPQVEEDEAEDEEDDSDEKDDEEDDKEEEDEKPSASVIVKSIDDDVLLSQVDVFLDDRDAWVIPMDEAMACDITAYSLNDLNYNGRADLIVNGWNGSTNESFVRIYEINEKGDGIDLLDWEFTGIDYLSEIIPDVAVYDCVSSYFDKNASEFHYIFRDFFSRSETNGGTRYCDVCIKDGTVVSDVYAKIENDGTIYNETSTYYGPDGEMSERDFVIYTEGYPKGSELKEFWLGYYYGDSMSTSPDKSITVINREELKSILIDSYDVFAGRMDYSDFYDAHVAQNNPEQSSEQLFYDSIGSWGLYMTDVEGDVNYYDSDTPYYMTLDIYDDWTLHFEEYLNTEHEYAFDMNILEHADGMLWAMHMPLPSDGMNYDDFLLTLVRIDDDGTLVTYGDSWLGGEYMGGGVWYFVRID